MPPTLESVPSVQIPPSIALLSVSFHTEIPGVVSANFINAISGQNVLYCDVLLSLVARW